MTTRGVLIVSPFFSPNMGGVETHLTDLCDYLAKNGNRVYVLTYQPLTRRVRAPSFEKGANLEIRRLNWPGYDLFNRLEANFLLEFLYLTPALLLFSMFYALRARRNIDVIHCHGINAAFVGVLLAKLFQKRCVVSIHAIYNLHRRKVLSSLIRAVLSNCAVVLTLAKRSKQELVRAGVDERKVRVFTYWVDQKRFQPLNKSECKKAIGLADRFLVLFVGRLLEIKGVMTFLEAARKLSYEHGVTFLVVGDGPYRRYVTTTVSALPNTAYLGPVSNANLPIYYNAADLTAVPSLYEEGYGRVILEALSCGTPVIASNRGGIPEAVESTVGVIIEPTAENLVQAVLKLFKNRELLEKMRQDCRPYARARFNERNARLIDDSYS